MNAEKYKVWCPDLDEIQEDAAIINAFDFDEAAEIWAEKENCNSGEYWILERGTTVYVMDKEGVTRKFTVTGEQTITYSASEIKTCKSSS